jgi:tetratricopeptide (TPR) repeat protein
MRAAYVWDTGHLSAALRAALLAALLAAAPASAQIPIGDDSAALPVIPSAGTGQVPGDDADGPDVSPKGDLLSGLESGSSGRSWFSRFSRLKGWLGAGGAPARQGAKAYAAGDYDLALQKFAEAQLDQPESQALAYNAGNAHFRKKKYDEAIASYKKALHGDDAALAASAHYNMGNAHFRKGEFAIQAGKQEGIEDYRAAMADYKKSLEIRPDNKDAKRNIEVVQARIKELLERQQQDQQNQQGNPQKPPEPSEEAKRVLARAMQLVAERRYAEAKALLEDIIQRDRTAASFQSHAQRIDDVLKILRGEAPAAPVPQDPRSQQPGVGVI